MNLPPWWKKRLWTPKAIVFLWLRSNFFPSSSFSNSYFVGSSALTIFLLTLTLRLNYVWVCACVSNTSSAPSWLARIHWNVFAWCLAVTLPANASAEDNFTLIQFSVTALTCRLCRVDGVNGSTPAPLYTFWRFVTVWIIRNNKTIILTTASWIERVSSKRLEYINQFWPKWCAKSAKRNWKKW